MIRSCDFARTRSVDLCLRTARSRSRTISKCPGRHSRLVQRRGQPGWRSVLRHFRWTSRGVRRASWTYWVPIDGLWWRVRKGDHSIRRQPAWRSRRLVCQSSWQYRDPLLRSGPMPGERCADTFLPEDAAFLNTEQLSLSWYLSKVIAFANGHLSKLFKPAPGTPMTRTPPPVDAEEYLENLMRAGQDAMKQFDDALVSAAGVGTKDSLSSWRLFFPFALIADLQREYFKQLW